MTGQVGIGVHPCLSLSYTPGQKVPKIFTGAVQVLKKFSPQQYDLEIRPPSQLFVTTRITLPETKPASLHLKMDDWNTIVSFWGV